MFNIMSIIFNICFRANFADRAIFLPATMTLGVITLQSEQQFGTLFQRLDLSLCHS